MLDQIKIKTKIKRSKQNSEENFREFIKPNYFEVNLKRALITVLKTQLNQS